MGNFNVLVANIKCSNCGNIYEGRIQFKYGHTRQVEYKIGDILQWGGNDIGKPGVKKVKVYGILESDMCSICGESNTTNEFDIIVEDGVLTEIVPMAHYDYLGEGNYEILEE